MFKCARQSTASLALLPLLFLEPSYANPINPDFPIVGSGPFTLIVWILSSLIEAAIIVFLLRRKLLNSRARTGMFLLIVLLNLITIVVTWIIGMQLLTPEHPNAVYLAELFPLIFEFLALLGLFSIFKHRNILDRVTPGYTLFLNLAANLVTFILGLAFFQYWPTPYNLYL